MRSNVEHLETIPAQDVVQAMQVVDDSAAKQLEQKLQQSRQGGYLPATAEEKAQHRALSRKLDLFLVPFCALIYLFNGLDRSNLGNAQTNGFTTELGIPAEAVNTATSLLLRDVRASAARVGRHREEGRAVVLARDHRRGLGRVDGGARVHQDGDAAYRDAAADRAVRSGLLPDGGVVPGAVLPAVRPGVPHRAVLRQLRDRRRVRGHHRVRVLPDRRGAAWVAVSVHHRGRLLAGRRAGEPFWLATSPGTAWFLTPMERRYAENRMMIDAAANFDSTHKLTRRDVREALLDWKLWLVFAVQYPAERAAAGVYHLLPDRREGEFSDK